MRNEPKEKILEPEVIGNSSDIIFHIDWSLGKVRKLTILSIFSIFYISFFHTNRLLLFHKILPQCLILKHLRFLLILFSQIKSPASIERRAEYGVAELFCFSVPRVLRSVAISFQSL